MKRFYEGILFFFLITLGITKGSFAQAPQGINYQAVARDAGGNPLATQTVAIEFKIHQTSSGGAVIYDETHSKTTNQFGLFTAIIGQGSVVSGTFSAIPWASNLFFLEVIVNSNNMGTTQFLSTPYSLHSATSGSATPSGTAGGDLTGSYPNPTIATGTITTTKIADNAVDGNKISLSGETNGDLMYYDNGSASWKRLPASPTSGQVLTNNGTATVPTWQTPSGGGTVTNVATGTGLTGGPVVNTGTISIANTGVTSGNYGSATQVPTYTVNAQGQITNAANVAISGTLPAGTANQTLYHNGTSWTPSSTIANSGASVTINGNNVVTGSQTVGGTSTVSGSATMSAGLTVNGAAGVFNNGFQLTSGVPGAGKILMSDAAGIGTWQAASGITGTGAANYLTRWATASTLTTSIMFENATGIAVNSGTPSGWFLINHLAGGGSKNLLTLQNTESANGLDVLFIQTNGNANGIDVSQSGIGRAGTFLITAAANTQAGVYSNTSGQGPALQAVNTNSTASATRYGVHSAVTGAGAATTNIAGYFTATSAVNNYAAIFDQGNVGIGTTAPQSRLHIQIPAGGGNQLQLGHNNQPTFEWRFDVDAASNMYLMNEGGGTAVPSMQWNPNTGNVGIGVAPTEKLEVAGKTKTTNFQMTSGAANMYVLTSDAAGNASWAAPAAGLSGGTATRLALWTGASTLGNSIIIDDGTNIGVGVAPSGSYKLQVNGRIGSTGINETSDLRYKKNISTIDHALEKVMGLRGVNYDWRTEEFKEKDFDNTPQIGLIAQEVEKIIPQVVTTDPNGYKSVEYSKLVALLIEAMKEQQKKIDALTAENQSLKNSSGAVSDEVKLMRADLKSLHDALDILLKENISLKEGRK